MDAARSDLLEAQYAKAWAGIKIRWNLTADRDEIAVLRQLLGVNAQLPNQAPEANWGLLKKSRKHK